MQLCYASVRKLVDAINQIHYNSDMQSNYFHKSCNKTVKRFYEDFDLLPKELKELLWDLPYMPDFDDLRHAWDLYEKGSSFDDLYKFLNVYEEDRKEDKLRAAREAKAKRDQERRDRYSRKFGTRRVDVYKITKVGEPRGDKHDRLIQRVSEEDAMRLLSQRKENKDVKQVTPRTIYTYIGTKEVPVDAPEPYHKELPPQSISKMLHNSGGKPTR